MNFSRQLRISFVLVAAISVALVTAVSAKRAKPKTALKFATLAPEGSTWMNIMHDMDAEIREATDNRLGLKFYPGGIQGDEKNVLRKMRNNQVHAGGFTGFGLGAIAPEFRAIELPFMFRNAEEVDYVRQKMDEEIRGIFDEKGFLFLGWADVGFVYIYSNEPVQSPQELREAKVWTWSGDKLAAIFFKAFDVSPIPLALPDVLTSLQMGVVNTVYAPPLACVALQWFTRVKYMSDVPITYGFGAMLVSKKALKSVSAEDVKTLKRIAEKHSRTLIEKTRIQNGEAITAMQKQGVEMLRVDAQVTDEFFATGRGAWNAGIGDLYPAELLQRVKDAVEEYRVKQAKRDG